MASTLIRHILLDWAKGKQRGKRGGATQVTLHDEALGGETEPETIIEIDRLLERMSSSDARKVKVVEMIFLVAFRTTRQERHWACLPTRHTSFRPNQNRSERKWFMADSTWTDSAAEVSFGY